VIRGAVYRIDLGQARRGHEQRGKRYGIVVSPTQLPWSIATLVPTSRGAGAAAFRPEVQVLGERTRALVDQVRSIDVSFASNEPVDVLSRPDLDALERAMARYLGLPDPDYRTV
jgi:mRNA interferase MazF